MVIGTILDVVNAPYEGDFGCYFGGYGRWMLRFWMLRKLDATLLDASILTPVKAEPKPLMPLLTVKTALERRLFSDNYQQKAQQPQIIEV